MEENINKQPQKEEEEKKKKGIVAWWLGLHRAAQVGICVGAAAIIATAITLPIVLTKNNAGAEHDITITVPQDEQWEKKYLNPSDYPTKIKSSQTTFTYKLKEAAPEGATIVLVDTTSEEKNIEESFNQFEGGETQKIVENLNLSKVTSIKIWFNAGQ